MAAEKRSRFACRLRFDAYRWSDGATGELRASIRDDHAGFSAALDHGHQFACDTTPRDRSVRDRCQTFPRHVINDV